MSNSCSICPEDDPRVLKEYHHIFGRSRAETILLCHNCHDKITKRQNEFPPFARKKIASPKLKRAYTNRSIGSLLEVIGKEMIKTSDDEILEEGK